RIGLRKDSREVRRAGGNGDRQQRKQGEQLSIHAFRLEGDTRPLSAKLVRVTIPSPVHVDCGYSLTTCTPSPPMSPPRTLAGLACSAMYWPIYWLMPTSSYPSCSSFGNSVSRNSSVAGYG